MIIEIDTDQYIYARDDSGKWYCKILHSDTIEIEHEVEEW